MPIRPLQCKAALESDPPLTVELKLLSEAMLLSFVGGLIRLAWLHRCRR